MTKKKHILLIDDEEQMRFSLSIILKQFNYKVTALDSGKKASEKIFADPNDIDLLILDVQMPGINGIELLKMLLEKEIFLPTIITSGDLSTTRKIPKAKHIEFLNKPFDAETLLFYISEMFLK